MVKRYFTELKQVLEGFPSLWSCFGQCCAFFWCYPGLQCWNRTEVVVKGEMTFELVLCNTSSLALMLLLKALTLEEKNPNFARNNTVINSYSASKPGVCTVTPRLSDAQSAVCNSVILYLTLLLLEAHLYHSTGIWSHFG